MWEYPCTLHPREPNLRIQTSLLAPSSYRRSLRLVSRAKGRGARSEEREERDVFTGYWDFPNETYPEQESIVKGYPEHNVQPSKPSFHSTVKHHKCARRKCEGIVAMATNEVLRLGLPQCAKIQTSSFHILSNIKVMLLSLLELSRQSKLIIRHCIYYILQTLIFLTPQPHRGLLVWTPNPLTSLLTYLLISIRVNPYKM